MGVIRFSVPNSPPLDPAQLARAYFAGPDGVPWPTACRIRNGLLEVERGVSDSGNFHVPWSAGPFGELTLSTGTLMERPEPYALVIELARGKLHQIRMQAAEWQEIGLTLPATFVDRLPEAVRRFSAAATARTNSAEDSNALAQQAVVLEIELAQLLARAYAEQALSVRRRSAARQQAWLAGSLGAAPLDKRAEKYFLAAFNAAVVPMHWRVVEPTEGNYLWQHYDREIDWSAAHQLPVVAGPLLRFDPAGMPDWLCLWEGDFENLFAVVSDYVETTVHRYRGKIALWNCAARMAHEGTLSLSEEERLRLAIRAVEVTRTADPETPAILSFDQPFAEYMHRGGAELSPLHVADALVRSELGLSGLGLELNVGYHPGGSFPRDPLAFSRLLDWWSCFNLPLYVSCTFPSSVAPDQHAGLRSAPLAGACDGKAPGVAQAEFIEQVLPMILAKPAVQGVIWSQFRDTEPHDFANGGLIDATGHGKTGLVDLVNLRKRYLG
jgi:hypothetical protein